MRTLLTACGTAVLAGVLLATPATAESTVSVARLTQSQAAAKLRAAGVSWSSSGGCTDRGRPNCTSFEQINTATVDGVITLKRASGCAITITGGTETGHASGTYSHWNGYKVDINPTTCVTDYIKRTFTSIGPRPGDGAPQYRSAAGNIYARESNHWDVLFHNCGCAR
jgi:hypothetical protein